MNPCRLGAVSYLNTRPLVYGLERFADELELHFDLPGRLADQLAAGELDVGLIPSVEVFQNPDYTVVSDACIGCCGPVWSVKLMSRCPVSEIRTLALDEGSRTSVVLVQILMQSEFGFLPELRPLPIDADWQSTQCDAVLVIGDRAMRGAPLEHFPEQVDMGQWWYRWTELPFVFAMWTARPGLSPERLNQLDRMLAEARNSGVRHAGEIADGHAAQYGLSPDQCLDYFHKYLHFRLGPSQRAGLERFRSLAVTMGLAPDLRELQFHGC